MLKFTFFSLIALCFTAMAPATLEPADSFTLSPLRITELKTISFLHKALTGTYQDAGTAAADVYKTIREKKIAPTAGIIFVFKDPKPDPTAQISMEIGVPVTPQTKAPDGYEISELESPHSATSVFTGNLKDVGPATTKFIGQVRQSGNEPAGPIRERVLYWEDENSDNNIVLIEVPLQSL